MLDTIENDAQAVKVINSIIDSLEKMKINTAVNAEEAVMFNEAIDSVKDARDNFASRNLVCIKHAEKIVMNQCNSCVEEEAQLR